jgi:glycosyltransferase involved in cell wall biosynthesis
MAPLSSNVCADPDSTSTQENTNRQLLLIAYYFPPVNESGAQRPFRFVRYLERHGYHTQVITASPQRDGAPWPDATTVSAAAQARGKARLRQCIWSALQRVLPYNDQLPWVSPAIQAAEEAMSSGHPQAILSTSPPVACHLAALALKRRFGLPWIADFRDPFYRNPHRTQRRFTQPYERVVERLIFQHADAIIANTDSAAEVMRRQYPSHFEKIHLIWNGYDPEQILKARPIPPREYSMILHAGSLYAGRHPGVLLESLHRLITRGQIDPAGIRVRLVGSLDFSRPWVSSDAFVALRQKGCLEYTSDVVPQQEALREMAEADYLLLLDENEAGVAVQVPAKLFQYIRIGRPILAFTAKNSPTERILARSGISYAAVQQEMPCEEIDERIRSFLQLSSVASLPSRWFEEQFNSEIQTGALAGILRSIGA